MTIRREFETSLEGTNEGEALHPQPKAYNEQLARGAFPAAKAID